MYNFESKEELLKFIVDNVIDTTEVSEILGCSRQNLENMEKNGKLIPLKRTSKVKLFFKPDVLEKVER